MSFDPKINRNEKDAIGDPGDSIATNTSEAWTMISLLKGMFNSLLTGISSTPSFTDDAAHTVGTTKTQPVAGTYRSVRDAVDDNDAGTLAMNPKRGLYVTLEAADSTPIALNAGAASAATLRIVAASDSPEIALVGAVTETASATDTASSGLNGRLQRVAQRLTSLIAQIPATLGVKARTASLSVAMATEDAALFPASLGSKAAASAFAVALSTEDAAQLGSLTETAPATDTASSGLNGRLQRIAQRITSLIALVPASLGAKTAAASFAVTIATDDAVMGGTADAAATAGSTGSISAKLRAISRDLVANIVLAAGTNLIGRAVADASAATGGIATTARLASAAGSTNATLVKASAGRIYQASGKNNAAYDVFLVLYDSAANPPVPGSTTIRKKIVCPAGAAFVYDWPVGATFATGIGYAFTKLVADADTTVLVAADITAFNLDYV
jgi:hypothetical protein